MGALGASAFVVGEARAESERAEQAEAPDDADDSSPARHHFRLGLGTGLTFGVSDIEERSADAYDITGMFQPYNLSVTPSYQLTPRWAVGVRAAFGTDGGMRGTGSSTGEKVSATRTLWELGAEGRHQFGMARGGYVAFNAGAAHAVDSVGTASASQWAPMLGAALGYDLSIAEPLALGVELRGGLAFFGDEGSTPSSRSETYVYGTSSWISFNLTGHLML